MENVLKVLGAGVALFVLAVVLMILFSYVQFS
jgi:hypothetical protein